MSWLADKTWYIQQAVETPSQASRCGMYSYSMLKEPDSFGHVFMSNSHVSKGSNELDFAEQHCYAPAIEHDPDSGHFLVSRCDESPLEHNTLLTIIAHNKKYNWMVAASKVTDQAADGTCQPSTEEGSGLWIMSTTPEVENKYVTMIRDHIQRLGYSVRTLTQATKAEAEPEPEPEPESDNSTRQQFSMLS
jgi:hypothetical protein